MPSSVIEGHLPGVLLEFMQSRGRGAAKARVFQRLNCRRRKRHKPCFAGSLFQIAYSGEKQKLDAKNKTAPH